MKSANPLQRGKACLSCRKRKMRCDGTRPVCMPCIKAGRETACQYHEKKQTSRTEMLREKVAKLEARLRELENEQSTGSSAGTPAPSSPESSSSSQSGDIFLLQPVASTSSAINDDHFPGLSPPSTSYSDLSLSPFPQSSWLPDVDLPLSLGLFSGPIDPFSSPRTDPHSSPFSQADDVDTFCQNKRQLLDVFLAHRHQCSFDVHIGRLRASLSASPHQQPHPALLDAMYLMGCYFSSQMSPQHSAQEPHYLQNALSGISSALQHNDRLVQIVQASCLIAVYFFSRGRVLEGYYHSSTAARLAVSLGLHQIKSEDWYTAPPYAATSTQPTFITFKPSLQLPPPQDEVEYDERVAAFWQVFLVDRAWSVASGLPAALPDDDSPRAQIETAWPKTINDPSFPSGDTDPLTGCDNGKLLPMLRANVITLFERTFRLSSKSFQTDDQFWVEHRILDQSLSHFAVNLPPVSSLMFQDHLSANDIELISIHTLMNASVIHIHRDFLSSYQRCFVAATAITNAVQMLNDNDYDYLNPILSTCWKCAAHIYLQALTVQQCGVLHNKPLVNSVYGYLNTLLGAMRALGRLFQVSAQDAVKTESAIAMTRSSFYVQ